MQTAETPRNAGPIELLTLEEVGVVCRVATATVKYWIWQGKIRVVKLGKHPLVEQEELHRFVQASKGR